MLTQFLFFLSFQLISFNSIGKVDPPNYNFKFQELETFFPGQPLEIIRQKHSSFKTLSQDNEISHNQVTIKALRYKIDVFFSSFKGKSLGFYAKLPSYFLHDTFHQSLINRFQKQNSYQLVNGVANYQWNKDGLIIIYNSTCTITCFPIFMTVFQQEYKEPELKEFSPLFLKTFSLLDTSTKK